MLTADGGVLIDLEQTRLWQERYRILFDHNIAGAMLTDVAGRIIDCNEVGARILAFHSRSQATACSAWDLYFRRAEREDLIRRLGMMRACPAETLCLRRGDGEPVWILASCAVVSVSDDRPELLQATFLEIAAPQPMPAGLEDGTKDAEPARTPESESSQAIELSERLAALLRRVNRVLQPHALSKIDRKEMQECVLALEGIKMLISRWEILSYLGKQ